MDSKDSFQSIFCKGRFPKSVDSRFMIRSGINEGAQLVTMLSDNNIFQDFVLKLSDNRDKPSRYDGKKICYT